MNYHVHMALRATGGVLLMMSGIVLAAALKTDAAWPAWVLFVGLDFAGVWLIDLAYKSVSHQTRCKPRRGTEQAGPLG